jgi:hypothetical protein
MPQRRRHIPQQFSWVDHRLVREGHVRGRSAPALALYLFLVAVADAEGLSWYSDGALCRWLSWDIEQLVGARNELCAASLLAYRTPLYQVLDLGPVESSRRASPRGDGEAVSVGDILQRALGGVR